MGQYPPEVQAFHRALKRLPGVKSAFSGIQSLHRLKQSDLPLIAFADLPIGALRRTRGGLDREALIQFEFEVAQSKAGWRSLEFLAWFVRDLARGSTAIQMRPKALPPTTHDSVQLGKTLRFQIDLFWEKAGKDLTPALRVIKELAKNLSHTIDLYDLALKQKGDAGLV
jgi:hypothetical protein